MARSKKRRRLIRLIFRRALQRRRRAAVAVAAAITEAMALAAATANAAFPGQNSDIALLSIALNDAAISHAAAAGVRADFESVTLEQA
jgi:hypothetical protein